LKVRRSFLRGGYSRPHDVTSSRPVLAAAPQTPTNAGRLPDLLRLSGRPEDPARGSRRFQPLFPTRLPGAPPEERAPDAPIKKLVTPSRSPRRARFLSVLPPAAPPVNYPPPLAPRACAALAEDCLRHVPLNIEPPDRPFEAKALQMRGFRSSPMSLRPPSPPLPFARPNPREAERELSVSPPQFCNAGPPPLAAPRAPPKRRPPSALPRLTSPTSAPYQEGESAARRSCWGRRESE